MMKDVSLFVKPGSSNIQLPTNATQIVQNFQPVYITIICTHMFAHPLVWTIIHLKRSGPTTNE